MTTDLSPVIVKKTQDTLGKFVKKPNLSDKLLRKPPFKFLHDVINVVIETTGFFKGLYTDEELNAENVKDRDAKINFLQKAIDVVKIATKESISAKPSKIVAGLEPEKTNVFLQAIARAIEKKICSDEAVETVKNGKVEPEKEKKVAKKKEDDGATTKTSKDKTGVVPNQKPKDAKDKLIQNDRAKKVSRQTSKDSNSSKTIPKTNKKTTDVKRVTEKTSPKALSKEKIVPKESIAEKENIVVAIKTGVENKNENENTLISEVENGKESVDVNQRDDQQPNSGKEKKTLEPDVVPADTVSKEAHSKENSATQKGLNAQESELQPNKQFDKHPEKEIELAPSVIPNSASGKKKLENISSHTKVAEEAAHSKAPEKPVLNGHSKGSKPSAESLTRKKSSFIKSSSLNNDEPGPSVRPTTVLRAPSARPPSARPGAPRRRDRNVEIILQTEKAMHDAAEKNTLNTNLVADLADDGENLVVIDNTDIQGDALPITTQEIPKDMPNEKEQGHLVQQILETQTTLSKAGNDGDDTKRDTDADVKTFIEKQSTSKNLLNIRDAIQKMTRFISPLGKLLEYIHEDVEAMQSELVMWRQARVKAEAAIKREKEQAEKSIESFKYQLFEIENSIEDQSLQINSTMANIIENEGKLYKMVLDV